MQKLSLIAITILLVTNLFGQNFWVPTNGIEGGLVNDFAEAPDGSWYITAGHPGYNGAYRTGLWKSINKGNRWTHLNSPIGLFSQELVNCIAINPANGEIYAGCYYGNPASIYRSDDGGANWIPLTDNLPLGIIIDDLFVDEQGNIYAGTRRSGIFWKPQNQSQWDSIPISSSVKYIFKNELGHLIALGIGGGQYSSDNGDTWSIITDLNQVNASGYAIDTSGKIYISSIFNGVLFSQDDGLNWSFLNNGMPGGPFFYNMGICITPSHRLFTCSYGNSIYEYSWNNQRWFPSNNGYHRTYLFNLTATKDQFIVATSNGGVYTTHEDTMIWHSKNSGLLNGQVYQLEKDSKGRFYAGTSGGIYKSEDNGNSWHALTQGLSNSDNIISLHLMNDSIIFAGCKSEFWADFSDGIYRSKDAGQTWEQVINGFSNTPHAITAITSDSINNIIYIASSDQDLYKSNDLGDTWTSIGGGIPNLHINSLLVDSSSIIVGTAGDGIFVSHDFGITWDSLNNGLGYGNLYINCIIKNPEHQIILGTGKGLFKWSSTKVAWVSLDTLKKYSVSDITFSNTGLAYVNYGSLGVLRYCYTDSLWLLVRDSFQYTIQGGVLCLLSDSSGYVYAGVSAGGIFKSVDNAVPTCTPDTISTIEKITTQILKIYPNPFENKIFVSTDGKQSITSLRIFDTLGRIVFSQNSEQNGEILTIENLGNLPSGLYFLTVSSGGFSSTHKILKE